MYSLQKTEYTKVSSIYWLKLSFTIQHLQNHFFGELTMYKVHHSMQIMSLSSLQPTVKKHTHIFSKGNILRKCKTPNRKIPCTEVPTTKIQQSSWEYIKQFTYSHLQCHLMRLSYF